MSSTKSSLSYLKSYAPVLSCPLPFFFYNSFFLSAAYFSFLIFLASFHFMKISKVTKGLPLFWLISSWRWASIFYSIGIYSISILPFPVSSFLSVYPGGRQCLYLQVSPLGQLHFHPYLPFSAASKKNLHTIFDLVPFIISNYFSPKILLTSSSESKLSSLPPMAFMISWVLWSTYKSIYSVLSKVRSWE